ncbi:MAG: SDR family oxidoreductase [Thermoplasmataceae archaeon]
METLIIGGSGQLGSELLKIIPQSIGTFRNNNSGGIILDLIDTRSIRKLIVGLKPKVIINTAALTNVDLCEKDEKSAYTINALAVREITMAAEDLGAYLIHVSTDYVFDGATGNYDEDAIPKPINYYGLSKLLGDSHACTYDNSLVVRTSGVFGLKGNFPRFVLDSLRDNKGINVVNSHYSPIHARMLAMQIKIVMEKKHTGILNIAGERVSRLELANRICDIFDLNKELINEVSESSLNWVARRPKDSSLNIDRSLSILGKGYSSIDANIKMMGEE